MDAKVGQQITTLDGTEYHLLTKWATTARAIWWAIAQDGKAYPVELTGDGWTNEVEL